MQKYGLKTSRKLLVAGVSCKRSPIVLGNRGLRQRAILASSPNSTLFPWGHVVLICWLQIKLPQKLFISVHSFLIFCKEYSISVTNPCRKFSCVGLEKFMWFFFFLRQGEKLSNYCRVLGREKKREELDKKLFSKMIFKSPTCKSLWIFIFSLSLSYFFWKKLRWSHYLHLLLPVSTPLSDIGVVPQSKWGQNTIS